MTESGRPFRILFVCTGNTCRSPMAEAIAEKILGERGRDDVEVASAGVSTTSGLPASDGARSVARKSGLDLTGHRSAQLTPERVEEADLILGMTPAHVRAVEALGGGGKVALLGAYAAGEPSGADVGGLEEPKGGEGRLGSAAMRGGPRSVPDPMGRGELEYAETLRTLESMVERVLSRVEPAERP